MNQDDTQWYCLYHSSRNVFQ